MRLPNCLQGHEFNGIQPNNGLQQLVTVAMHHNKIGAQVSFMLGVATLLTEFFSSSLQCYLCSFFLSNKHSTDISIFKEIHLYHLQIKNFSRQFTMVFVHTWLHHLLLQHPLSIQAAYAIIIIVPKSNVHTLMRSFQLSCMHKDRYFR